MAMGSTQDLPGRGPLTGVRVLEASRTPAGRTAGMLLSDLGAEVVRLAPSDDVETAVAFRDRGKKVLRADMAEFWEALEDADVLILDDTPSQVQERGLDPEAVRRLNADLVHVWMPPYGSEGRWKDLPADDLLLAAVGGVSLRFPASDDRPIAPVVANTTQIHGALGAAAALAGLVGREHQGAGSFVEVSGLQAVGVQMVSMFAEGLDQQVFTPGRGLKGPVPFRPFRASDGEWVFVAALTPALFFAVLDVLDCHEVMAYPEVGGEFMNIVVDELGGDVVARKLEEVYATKPRDEWIALLEAGGVPCAPMQTWQEWCDSDYMTALGGLVTIDSPRGPARTPNHPLSFERHELSLGAVPSITEARTSASVWDTERAWVARNAAKTLERHPLSGVKVVDMSTFLAGPLAATLLADFGADVVKVEPVTGDPYRSYPIAFLPVNRRKRGVGVNLRQPAAHAVIHDLLREADVLVENSKPSQFASFGLDQAQMRELNPRLVHFSMSGYGRGNELEDKAAFDPIFQSLSGMALGQGGDDRPITSNTASHDTGGGILGAVGILAALYELARTDRGQRVELSLATTSNFLQMDQFSSYPGGPAPERGSLQYVGPHDGHRLYACSDGWVAVFTDAERITEATNAWGDGSLEERFAGLTTEQAVERLTQSNVTAAVALGQDNLYTDELFYDNDRWVVVNEEDYGRIRIVNDFSTWDGIRHTGVGASFHIGAHTREVLRELGWTTAQIGEQVAAGALAVDEDE